MGAGFKIHPPCFMLLHLDILKPSLVSVPACVCVHVSHLYSGFFFFFVAVFDEFASSHGV